jgi:hypothetical protein
MGFSPAEVAAGVADMLAAADLAGRVLGDGDGTLFEVGEVRIRVSPLPAWRTSSALVHPRALLVLEGAGPIAERLKDSIRLRFLRVTG